MGTAVFSLRVQREVIDFVMRAAIRGLRHALRAADQPALCGLVDGHEANVRQCAQGRSTKGTDLDVAGQLLVIYQ